MLVSLCPYYKRETLFSQGRYKGKGKGKAEGRMREERGKKKNEQLLRFSHFVFPLTSLSLPLSSLDFEVRLNF
jgi:hypothetical protein